MRLNKLFTLLLALPFFLAGCSNDPEVEAISLTSTLESDVLNFDPEGGNGIITYTLANAPKDAQLEVACEADWVTNINVGTNVAFKVLPNEDAARSTQITVSYKSYSFSVTINQAAREYACDLSFTTATRVSLVGQLPDNNFYIIFTDEQTGSQASLFIIGAEEDLYLKAGTYTDADAGNYYQLTTIYLDENTPIDTTNCTNTTIVEGDVTGGYNITSIFIAADQTRYRVRFSGVIDGMADGYNHITSSPETLQATHITGFYYALDYSITYNYTVYLSDAGVVNDAYVANGKYYALDLYGLNPTFDAEGYLYIPQGTYTFDPTDSQALGSISNAYSSYFVMSASGIGCYASGKYDDATIVVTENSITLDATILGAKHSVTYNGTPKFYVGKSEDRTFEAKMLYGEYYGTEYTETSNYTVWLTDIGFDEEGYAMPGGTYYAIDLYGVEPEIDTEGYLHIPYGTYKLDASNTYPEWSIGGYYSYFYIFDDEGQRVAGGSFEEITAVVSESGITVNASQRGGLITATYVGEPKFYVGTTRAAVQSRRASISIR